MRIMKKQEWQHVRVINLSDYRNPKSNSFYSELKTLEKIDCKSVHSIFCEQRKEERENI